MTDQIWVVGAGPGAREYLAPIARRAIEQAETLIGGSRLLNAFCSPGQKQLSLGADLEPALNYIRENWRRERICVVVSGDPGLFSLLPKVVERIGKEAVRVIPGLSSVQLAFARFCETWENAVILSLHGRNIQADAKLSQKLIRQAKEVPKLALLTEAQFPPHRIADFLLTRGVPNRRTFIAQSLSYPDEKLLSLDLKSLLQTQDLNQPGIMILTRIIRDL